MTLKIKQGTLSDFLDSARDTAREIDSGKKLTRKKTVWVEPGNKRDRYFSGKADSRSLASEQWIQKKHGEK